jgi:hypothetical protein
MGNERASSASSAELSEPSKPVSLGTSDDFVLADLNPGMRRQAAPFTGNAKADTARNTSPAQHGLCCQRTWQTKSVHPGSRAEVLDRP